MTDEGGPHIGGLDQQIEKPRLKALFRLWDGRRNGLPMPDWDSFDILEMGAWIGNLTLLEVIPDPLDMIYRVFATRVSENLRRELTGRRLSESEHLIPRDVRDSYYVVLRSGRPRLHHLDDMSDDGQSVILERLLLPLSKDGLRVNMILVGY
ncbi:MAG: PAS domain-containing protein [Alphaproteobacteria bacterium]